MKSSLKIGFTLVLIAGTLAYGVYQKRKIDEVANDSAPIVQKLPNAEINAIEDMSATTLDSFVGKHRGLFVHVWGTWCAPCEEELPSFIDYAKQFESKDVLFILLAVNDKEKDVKKFIRRFSKVMPDNVKVFIDEDGSSMKKLATVKVPETFLFSGEGLNLKKFVGPHDWSKTHYLTQVEALLNK